MHACAKADGKKKMNDWSKGTEWRHVGRYIREDILMGMDGISRKMLLGAGLSVPEI